MNKSCVSNGRRRRLVSVAAPLGESGGKGELGCTFAPKASPPRTVRRGAPPESPSTKAVALTAALVSYLRQHSLGRI